MGNSINVIIEDTKADSDVSAKDSFRFVPPGVARSPSSTRAMMSGCMIHRGKAFYQDGLFSGGLAVRLSKRVWGSGNCSGSSAARAPELAVLHAQGNVGSVRNEPAPTYTISNLFSRRFLEKKTYMQDLDVSVQPQNPKRGRETVNTPPRSRFGCFGERFLPLFTAGFK